MSRRTIQGKKFLWHHIVKLEAEDVEFLRSDFQFHALDFEDLAAEAPIPKLDLYKYYLFAVFQIPRWNDTLRIMTDDLEIFLGADYLVTITRRPVDAIERFVGRVERNARFHNETLAHGPAFLLYKLLRYAFYHAQPIASDLVKRLAEIEERVYNAHDRSATRDLAYIRRDILFLRSSVEPQGRMLHSLSSTGKPYLAEDMSPFFNDVRDTLSVISTRTDNLQQVVDGLFDVNDALLTHRTNDIVTLFTAVAAALMPPTLLASLYGMNVSSLPFDDHPGEVIAIILLIAVGSFFGVFALLKRYR